MTGDEQRNVAAGGVQAQQGLHASETVMRRTVGDAVAQGAMPHPHGGFGLLLGIPEKTGDHLSAEGLGHDDQRYRTGLVEHLVQTPQDLLLGA
ncbi:hypothetical protein D3C78_1098360 [compost metagenome]